MLSPLPRRSVWAYCFAHFAQPCQPSPIWRSGRPAHRPFRGLLGVHSRYGLHTRAVTVYRDPLIRRLQPIRFLHSCSGCFRLERLPGGTCTTGKRRLFTAHANSGLSHRGLKLMSAKGYAGECRRIRGASQGSVGDKISYSWQASLSSASRPMQGSTPTIASLAQPA